MLQPNMSRCNMSRLRLQPNMSRCNKSRGSSEVTTEYVPLQYVSWLVWCCNRIHPAAICISLFCIAHFCTSLTLKLQYHGKIWKMLWNDMHEVPSWIWSLFGIAQFCTSPIFSTLLIFVPHSHSNSSSKEDILRWFEKCYEMICMKCRVGFFYIAHFCTSLTLKNHWMSQK